MIKIITDIILEQILRRHNENAIVRSDYMRRYFFFYSTFILTKTIQDKGYEKMFSDNKFGYNFRSATIFWDLGLSKGTILLLDITIKNKVN